MTYAVEQIVRVVVERERDPALHATDVWMIGVHSAVENGDRYTESCPFAQ